MRKRTSSTCWAPTLKERAAAITVLMIPAQRQNSVRGERKARARAWGGFPTWPLKGEDAPKLLPRRWSPQEVSTSPLRTWSTLEQFTSNAGSCRATAANGNRTRNRQLTASSSS